MHTPPPPTAPHTDGLAAALQASGLATGRGQAPERAGWQGEPGKSSFVPYVVLWPSPGATLDADARCLNEPHLSVVYTCQLTVVGATQSQTERAADTAKQALVGQRVPVTGRSTHPTELTLDRPAERDDAVAPSLHYTVTQVSIISDPA